jgi:ubiquitin C-terminal hydrolase
MSPCDVSDPLDKLTESIFKNFERRAMQGYPNSHSAALASSAVSIIQMLLSMNISAFLKSFLEIPSSRRQAIVRLLLCSCSCSNLQYGPNEFSLHLQLLLLELLSAMASSFLQCDVLNEIVDFVQQDSSMLSPNVSLHWFDPFLKNRRFVRDGCTTSESLLRATSRILRSICKFMGIAKRNEDVRCFKLPSLFVLQSFILQLISPMDISSQPLARECSESFRAIFDVAAFPQEVTLSDASDDLKLNVLSPRPLTLLLKRPLFAQEDDACLEFSQLVHEAAFRFPGFCSAVFETLLHHSESMLTFEEKLPSGSSSNIGSYHGILNLGCTCYFNSITQQLFMLPGFAASVIAAQVKADAPQDSEVVEESKVDVSKSAISTPNAVACGVLEKFKELMISLRHGSGPVVHPKNFCDSFRFPDGSCILPDVQQDALEYFHILCDHLDNALKGGNDEKLLSRFFGGRSATQLICRGCPHRYERFEHFFTLQLAVFSNRSNSVMGALQDFVAGELLEGDNQYFCSQCNKKVDTVKRTVLADLPDSIILGLKRFDFNYDTMQRIKLNVDVPFSEDLDMSAFCRENLSEIPQNSEPVTKRDAGYYQYSLAGIVVHSGMADSGHYFSIIRDPKQVGLWHKFNDDIVTPIQNFDLKQFFGGHFSGKHVHTNAYILVYNRKVAIFNHQYNQITSLENAVEAVQETEKLSTQTMFLDTLRNKHLWNCFTLSMQKLFASSDDGRMETAYMDLILKVNTCSDLDSVESVESFLQPLEGSLRNAKKCNSILESCFARFDDGPTVDSVLFQPVVDACSKRLHQLPLLFTHIMAQITSAVNGSDMLLFNSDEKVIQLGIVCKILNFYGNLSTRLFRLFPHENHLDIEPLTPPVALAVQYCLHQALEHGLTRICFQYLCLSAQQSNESAELFLLRTCLTAANYSHLCEDGTKLRSKRRAYLRAFVRDCRFLSCWNCLKLLKICFVDQSFVPLQDFLDHGAWSECFTTLFAPDFMIRFIYSDPVPIPLHLNILVMFYEVTQKMLPLVRFILVFTRL